MEKGRFCELNDPSSGQGILTFYVIAAVFCTIIVSMWLWQNTNSEIYSHALLCWLQ